MNNKFDWKLFWAISLPVLFIIALAGIVLIPNALAKPKYDILFSELNDYSYNQTYNLKIVNDKITAQPSNRYNYNNNNTNSTDLPATDLTKVNVKRYSQQTKKVETLTVEQANKLTLSAESESPDGFTVGGSNSYGGLVSDVLVGGSYDSYNQLYLIKGLAKKKIDLGTNRYGFNFLAWVIE